VGDTLNRSQGNCMPEANSSQPRLWSDADFTASVAEAALLHFTSAYLAGLREAPSDRPLERWMDEHSYACLLLCEEHGDALTQASLAALEKCRDAVSARPLLGLYDMLPWNAALHALGKARSAPDRLVSVFTNGASDLRGFAFEIGWFVRRRLPVEKATEALLCNVADTLGGWDISLGLCSSLYESVDAFWATADEYQPEPRWEGQYRDRLTLVREQGLAGCRYHLTALESRIRHLIMDFAMRLGCPQAAA